MDQLTSDVRAAFAALLDPDRRARPDDVIRLMAARGPGVYAWFVDATGARALESGLGLAVRPGLIYAGQTGAGRSTATLGSRISRNHLGGNIYGSTFRLTLAAILRAQLDLIPAGHRRMDPAGEQLLTEWIHAHLAVTIAGYTDRLRLDAFEAAVLHELDPPFNLAKRPRTPTRDRLTELRRVFTGAVRPRPNQPLARASRPVVVTSVGGLTPEELARELGLPNAKRVRSFLREQFPRPESELWSRWGPLPSELEAAVRRRFGRQWGSGRS